MAAPSISPAPTPTARYIRVYLLTWGVLAAGGLGYLASLAWQPELFQYLRSETAEVDQGLRLANRALTEVGQVRRALGDVERDLGQVRETMAARDAQDQRVQARITALEERVASEPVAATAPEPPAQKPAQKPAEKPAEKAKVDKSHKGGATRLAERNPETPGESASPAIETGSIPAASPVITFGEPVVTPSKAYAVQLAAGPSLDAMRASWTMLLERHSSALGALKPHVVAPRAGGTAGYRLVAGPLPSRAEAERLCAALGVGHHGCFATPFAGQPL